MMRKRHVAVLAVGLLGPPLLLSGLPARAATPDYTQYAEHTTVAGKLPVDLRGVWFIVAQPTVTKDGKSKTLPQLIAVSQEGAKLTLHLMDVRLPKGMADAVREANEKLKPWSPSDADIALLRQQWSKLPPATDTDPKAGDLRYAQVGFVAATAYNPLPFNVGGSFTMYRLASSAPAKKAPPAASKAPPARRGHRPPA